MNFPGLGAAGSGTDRAHDMQAARLRDAQGVHGLPAGYYDADAEHNRASADPAAGTRPMSWLERFFRRVIHRQKG